MNRTFTILLVAAMVLGIVAGLVSHAWLDADQTKAFADGLGLITTSSCA